MLALLRCSDEDREGAVERFPFAPLTAARAIGDHRGSFIGGPRMKPSEHGAGAGDDLLGRAVLGNYVVEKKLGEGGMGAVYRLKHNRLPDTFAALKVMSAEESEHMQARFEQEAMVAAAIGSHRVARPLDLGRFDDGTPYIVMEYVDGKSLEQELRDLGPLDVTTALKIACRIADTLALAHEKGIVHRDIKPPNVMLQREGEKDARSSCSTSASRAPAAS